MTAFRTALAFLTRIPVGNLDQPTVSRLSGAAGYFPLVGGIVAAVGLVTWVLAEILLGPVVAAVASVAATVIVTGALHEDGLADTADGLWGGGTAQQRLDIMRDSRIGTYGVLALATDLLVRAAILAPLGAVDVARVLVAGHVIGRGAVLVIAATLPPARAGGLGQSLGRVGRGGALGAGATVIVAAVATSGIWSPVVLAIAGVTVTAVWRTARRRIGGYTGDVLGASVLVTNLAVAATTAALIHRGML